MQIGRYTAFAMLVSAGVIASVAVNPGGVHAQETITGDAPMAAPATANLASDTPDAPHYHYRKHARISGNPPNYRHCKHVFNSRGYPVGDVCFTSYGDKFWINDLSADGLYIQMRGWMITGNWSADFYCFTTRTSRAGWQVCDGAWWAGNIPEREEIFFRAELHSWDGRPYTGRDDWTLQRWGPPSPAAPTS